MKIAFLSSGNVKSNFSYRIVALARGLHRLGHDVSIIAPSADKYNDFIPEHIDVIDGIRILQPFQFATRHAEINLLPYVFSAARMVLRERADLIYIYKPTPITIVGLAAKLFYRTPVVLDMDDLGSEVMRIEGHPWHQRALVAWCERAAARHADRIVVASRYLYRKYRREFPDKPILILPNGVEADWFAPPVVSEKKKRVLFMGAINRENILDPLFRTLPSVLKAHPNAQLLVIGDGKYLPHFKAMSRALDMEQSICFTGWLALDEARARLCAGDIGYSYMPSDATTKAASNMKVPQYMARGVVPIVSNVGDLPLTVDFGNAGYVAKADDIRALERTLIAALADDDRLKKAARARAIAREKLSWDMLAKKFERWNSAHLLQP
jgi:glycosyltransferase involved in cell wall biosynthesis